MLAPNSNKLQEINEIYHYRLYCSIEKEIGKMPDIAVNEAVLQCTKRDCGERNLPPSFTNLAFMHATHITQIVGKRFCMIGQDSGGCMNLSHIHKA